MADRFGAISLPASPPAKDEALTDPLLTYALGYFKAVINANGTAAWQARIPDGSIPVNKTHPHDPLELSFVENDLPALYMWETDGSEGTTERLAEDIFIDHRNVHVLWIMPPEPEEKQKYRVQFTNAVRKSLILAIERGRHPAWVVSGDTDPQAATRGSVFMRWAGIIAVDLSRWTKKIFIVTNEETKEKYAFHAFEATLAIQEELVEDISGLASSTVDVTEGLPVDDPAHPSDLDLVTDHAIFT